MQIVKSLAILVTDSLNSIDSELSQAGCLCTKCWTKWLTQQEGGDKGGQGAQRGKYNATTAADREQDKRRVQMLDNGQTREELDHIV